VAALVPQQASSCPCICAACMGNDHAFCAYACPRRSAPAQTLEQVKGAVLHELRNSGPLGLSLAELMERLRTSRWTIIDAAESLAEGGRARWVRDGAERLLQLTACQRELDDALRANSDAYAFISRVEKERDEIHADLERAAAEMVGARALSAIGHAIEAGQVPVSSGWVDAGSLDDAYWSTRTSTSGHEAAHRAGLIAVAEHTRRAIGETLRRMRDLASPHESEAYARGLEDAAHVASYGNLGPSTHRSVRIVFQDGTMGHVLVLDDGGPTYRQNRFVLGSGTHGRLFAHADGQIGNSPVRIHPADLRALLASDGARDQHAGDGGAGTSDCQHLKSDGVASCAGGA
jgi:hypothetical protein